MHDRRATRTTEADQPALRLDGGARVRPTDGRRSRGGRTTDTRAARWVQYGDGASIGSSRVARTFTTPAAKCGHGGTSSPSISEAPATQRPKTPVERWGNRAPRSTCHAPAVMSPESSTWKLSGRRRGADKRTDSRTASPIPESTGRRTSHGRSASGPALPHESASGPRPGSNASSDADQPSSRAALALANTDQESPGASGKTSAGVASAAATAHVNARKTITEMKYRGDIQTPTHAARRRIADGAPRHLQRRTHHSRTVIVEQRSRHGFDPPSPDTGGRRHRTRGAASVPDTPNVHRKRAGGPQSIVDREPPVFSCFRLGTAGRL